MQHISVTAALSCTAAATVSTCCEPTRQNSGGNLPEVDLYLRVLQRFLVGRAGSTGCEVEEPVRAFSSVKSAPDVQPQFHATSPWSICLNLLFSCSRLEIMDPRDNSRIMQATKMPILASSVWSTRSRALHHPPPRGWLPRRRSVHRILAPRGRPGRRRRRHACRHGRRPPPPSARARLAEQHG